MVTSPFDGNIIAGMYPDISTEPWAEYRQALEDQGYDGIWTAETSHEVPRSRNCRA